MKSLFFIFLIGVIIGSSICYFLLTRSKTIAGQILITSSNPNVIISDQNLTIKKTANEIKSITSFTADKTSFTNTITFNRNDLQFNHTIYAETSYFISSQMPFFSISYSYKWLLISTKIGYSFRLNTIDYGLGIGMNYKF